MNKKGRTTTSSGLFRALRWRARQPGPYAQLVFFLLERLRLVAFLAGRRAVVFFFVVRFLVTRFFVVRFFFAAGRFLVVFFLRGIAQLLELAHLGANFALDLGRRRLGEAFGLLFELIGGLLATVRGELHLARQPLALAVQGFRGARRRRHQLLLRLLQRHVLLIELFGHRLSPKKTVP